MRTSKSFLWILLIGTIGLFAGYIYWNRDAEEFNFVALFLAVVVLLIPFAVAFAMLFSRILSEGVTNWLTGFGRGVPSKPKYIKARLLLAEDKFEEAVAEFIAILNETPTDTYCQEQIAVIYAEKLRDYRRAVEEYHKLLDMRTSEKMTVQTLNRLADIYGDHLGDNNSAAKSLRTIIHLYPDSVHANRAELRLKSLGPYA